MQAITLTITIATLWLVGLTHAKPEYYIRCTENELAIRWPSYTSHSQYYICQSVGGKVMTIDCTDGEVFTYVMQSCLPYSKYIPAPPQNTLPLSKAPIQPLPGFSPNRLPPKPMAPVESDKKPMPAMPSMPKPLYPTDIVSNNAPPAPMNAIPSPPIVNVPAIQSAPLLNSQVPEKTDAVPMPATPAPTPPVVTPPMVNAAAADNSKAPIIEASAKKPTQMITGRPTPTGNSGTNAKAPATLPSKKPAAPSAAAKKSSTKKTSSAAKKPASSAKTNKKIAKPAAKSAAKSTKTSNKKTKPKMAITSKSAAASRV